MGVTATRTSLTPEAPKPTSIQGLAPEDLAEIRARLEAAFGQRLQRIVVYGSRARCDAHPDSDLDIMVLLDADERFGEDLDTVIDALYPLQLRLPFPLDAHPVQAAIYDGREYPLYIEAGREGLLL